MKNIKYRISQLIPRGIISGKVSPYPMHLALDVQRAVSRMIRYK